MNISIYTLNFRMIFEKQKHKSKDSITPGSDIHRTISSLVYQNEHPNSGAKKKEI